MIERVRNLDAVGRATAVVVALIVLVGALLAVTTLTGDDDGGARVDTAASSTTERSTTSTSSTSTSTTVDPAALASTTTAVPGTGGAAGTTTTTRRSGGGTGTTQPSNPGTTPATQPPVTQPPATTAPPTQEPSGSCTAATRGDESDRLATLFCNYRANNGLAKMVRTSALNQMAQEWATKLANDHALSHRASADMRARTLAACTACNGWAENVAFIQPVDPDGLWQNWLNSPTHLANIRDGHAGEYGMAIAKLPDGSLWAVQNFGRYP